MFLSQTETYASMNYRLMSLARYGAEAGVEKAANVPVRLTIELRTLSTTGARSSEQLRSRPRLR